MERHLGRYLARKRALTHAVRCKSGHQDGFLTWRDRTIFGESKPHMGGPLQPFCETW